MHILELFDLILSRQRSVDMAESEFRMMIAEDPALRKQYRDWCKREGLTEKTGFIYYCNNYLDREEDRWEILADEEDY